MSFGLIDRSVLLMDVCYARFEDLLQLRGRDIKRAAHASMSSRTCVTDGSQKILCTSSVLQIRELDIDRIAMSFKAADEPLVRQLTASFRGGHIQIVSSSLTRKRCAMRYASSECWLLGNVLGKRPKIDVKQRWCKERERGGLTREWTRGVRDYSREMGNGET